MTKNIYDNTEIGLDNIEEIEWKDIALSLLRSKKFISIFTFISVILSILYSFAAKKTWEGEFQIVLILIKDGPQKFFRLSRYVFEFQSKFSH